MYRAIMRASVSGIVLCSMTLPPAAQTAHVQKEIAKYEANYERKTKPVDRAKAVVKLGRAEYVAASQSLDAGNVRGAFEFLAKYNEQAITAQDRKSTRLNSSHH